MATFVYASETSFAHLQAVAGEAAPQPSPSPSCVSGGSSRPSGQFVTVLLLDQMDLGLGEDYTDLLR